MKSARAPWLAIPLVLAAYFTLIVTANGVPALRHDWYLPDFYQPLLWTTSGWGEQGIGGPNVFVNDSLLAIILAPIGGLLGSFAAFFAFAFGIALGVLLAARKLALSLGSSDLTAAAVGAFALFNPWVYTEIVAGHLPMIVAYAATMALVSEIVRAQPRADISALAVAFTVCQIQFFVPAFVAVVLLGLRRRIWLPVTTWFAVGGATMVGVLFRAHEYAATPLTLAWEQTQSVAPHRALLLTGYFAQYTFGFDRLGHVAVLIVLIVAGIGAVLSWRSRRTLAAVAVSAIALLVAMGLRGPAAGVLVGALTVTPAFGLYRELYDVIAYAAIGYIVLGVAAAARNAALSYALAAAALLLVANWAVFPPTSQWVNRSTLPRLPTVALPQTRFALMPPFQPLSYMHKYAGLDPDASIRDHGVTPLNFEVPTWPEDAALAAYAQTGDWHPLADLSVSEIANRAWYATASRELQEQLALRTAPREALTSSFVVGIPAIPELSIVPIPRAAPVANHPGAASIFFGDAAGLSDPGLPEAWSTYERPRPVVPGANFVHADEGWVDARLGFAADPELGQAFGGALTTNPSALLTLSGGDEALAFVRGALLSERGRVLASSSGGYQWIAIPADVARVRCRGLCVVALEGHVPPGLEDDRAPAPYRALLGRKLLPWLVQTDVTPGAREVLRYNERYDEHWLALGIAPLAHIRLDGSVNGWLLPSRNSPTTVWLVEWVALVQAVAQALGAMWVLALCWVAYARHRDGLDSPR